MPAHPDRQIRWKQFSRLGQLTYGTAELDAISKDSTVAKSIRDEALRLHTEIELFRPKYTNAIHNIKVSK